jgi:hypothetical protein
MFRENAIFRTQLEKYATRTTAAVTIGINQSDTTKPFELALWAEGPWEYDKVMEELLEQDRKAEKKMLVLKKGKKFGRALVAAEKSLSDAVWAEYISNTSHCVRDEVPRIANTHPISGSPSPARYAKVES